MKVLMRVDVEFKALVETMRKFFLDESSAKIFSVSDAEDLEAFARTIREILDEA